MEEISSEDSLVIIDYDLWNNQLKLTLWLHALI